MILSIGNFLNDYTNRSHTRAIDTKTLRKVLEVRATGKSNYTLGSFIVETCLNNPDLTDAIQFMDDMEKLQEAAKCNDIPDVIANYAVTVDMLEEELQTLETGVTCIEAQLGNEEEMEGDFFQFFDAINVSYRLSQLLIFRTSPTLRAKN